MVDQPGFELESIKKETGVVEDNSHYKSGVLSSRSVSVISISQIFENVNSEDILRYAPDNMLNDRQKKEAVALRKNFRNATALFISKLFICTFFPSARRKSTKKRNFF